MNDGRRNADANRAPGSRSGGPLSPARWAAWQRLNAQNSAGGRSPQVSSSSSLSEIDSAPEAAEGDFARLERRERAVAERIVKGVWQHRALIDALIEKTPGIDWARTAPKLREMLRIAVYEKLWQRQAPDYAVGAQAVELARKAAGEGAARFMNAAARRLMENLPADSGALEASDLYRALPETTRWSIPQGIVDLFREAYGRAAADAALAAMSESQPAVWLRANTLKIAPDALAGRLKEEGVETEALAGLPEALRWSGGENRPWETAAWDEGLLTVQDAGAMLAARALDVLPGQRVLDFCAAPGGKAGHLWEMMGGAGELVAWEPDAARRRTMTEALKRLYGAEHGIKIPESLDETGWGERGSFDQVLVDAPCLALGLIRRHPEIRWDGRERKVHILNAKQSEILEEASAWLKPGGRLLWVTCSPTRAENEDLIQTWLAKKPEWRAIPPENWPGTARPDWTHGDAMCQRTLPDRICCDGFALILLERR